MIAFSSVLLEWWKEFSTSSSYNPHDPGKMILDCLHWLLQSCCDCGHVSQIKEGRFHFPSTLVNQQLNQILLLISAFHLNRFAHLLRGLIWRSLDYPSNHWCALPGNWRRARKSHAPCDWLLGIAVCETQPNRPWASLSQVWVGLSHWGWIICSWPQCSSAGMFLCLRAI